MSFIPIPNEVLFFMWNLMEKILTVQICISISVYWISTKTILFSLYWFWKLLRVLLTNHNLVSFIRTTTRLIVPILLATFALLWQRFTTETTKWNKNILGWWILNIQLSIVNMPGNTERGVCNRDLSNHGDWEAYPSSKGSNHFPIPNTIKY